MSFSADLSPLLLHGSKAGNSYDDPGTIWVTTGPLRNVQQRGVRDGASSVRFRPLAGVQPSSEEQSPTSYAYARSAGARRPPLTDH
jgi:hypothetical protein